MIEINDIVDVPYTYESPQAIDRLLAGSRSPHKGIDVGIPVGNKVRTPITGITVSGFDDCGYGNYQIIRGDDYDVLFAHLQETVVDDGQLVKAGTVVALSGNSSCADTSKKGRSTGPHLHIEFREKETGRPYKVDVNLPSMPGVFRRDIRLRVLYELVLVGAEYMMSNSSTTSNLPEVILFTLPNDWAPTTSLIANAFLSKYGAAGETSETNADAFINYVSTEQGANNLVNLVLNFAEASGPEPEIAALLRLADEFIPVSRLTAKDALLIAGQTLAIDVNSGVRDETDDGVYMPRLSNKVVETFGRLAETGQMDVVAENQRRSRMNPRNRLRNENVSMEPRSEVQGMSVKRRAYYNAIDRWAQTPDHAAELINLLNDGPTLSTEEYLALKNASQRPVELQFNN